MPQFLADGGRTRVARTIRVFRPVGRTDPFSRQEWLTAVRRAPTIKDDYFTVLSLRDCLGEARAIMEGDSRLAGCFTD